MTTIWFLQVRAQGKPVSQHVSLIYCKVTKRKPKSFLLLAFGREAAEEMKQRLDSKIGLVCWEGSRMVIFHQLGLKILNEVETERVVIR